MTVDEFVTFMLGVMVAFIFAGMIAMIAGVCFTVEADPDLAEISFGIAGLAFIGIILLILLLGLVVNS